MRPRRVYKNQKGRYYYLVKGKKKFIKTPAGVSDKKVININIKNIQPSSTSRKIKRRKKRRTLKYGKNVTKDMKPLERATSGTVTASQLPVYLFEPSKNIESIISSTMRKGDEKKKDDDIKKLKDEILLLKNEPHNIGGVIDTEDKKKKKKPVEETKGEDDVEEVVTENPLDTTYESELEFKINEFLRGYDRLDKRERDIKADFKKYLNDTEPNSEFTKDINKTNSKPSKEIYAKLDEIINPTKKERGVKNMEEQIKELIPFAITEFFATGMKIKGIQFDTIRKKFTAFLKGNAKYSFLVTDKKPLNILIGNILRERVDEKLTEINSASLLGKGKGKAESHALWNTEIEKILKKTIKPDFVPVIASDKCEELYDHVYEGMPDFSFIMNTAK